MHVPESPRPWRAPLAGVHILTDKRIDTEIQPLAVAKLLAKIVEQETPELVLVGKQSIDGDNNQTGTSAPRMSGPRCVHSCLGCPHPGLLATYAPHAPTSCLWQRKC